MSKQPDAASPRVVGESGRQSNRSDRGQDEPPDDRELRRLSVLLRLEATRRRHRHAATMTG